MKPGIAVLIGVVLGFIGLKLYESMKQPGTNNPMLGTPTTLRNTVSSRCNCSVTQTTPSGEITQKGVLTANSCDISANCS